MSFGALRDREDGIRGRSPMTGNVVSLAGIAVLVLLTVDLVITCSLARYRLRESQIAVEDRLAAVAIKTIAPSGVRPGTNLVR